MQLNLKFEPLNNKNPYLKEEFLLLPENSAAFNFLKDFFLQNQFLKTNAKLLILKGSSCSGKTHLLHIFATEFNAEFISYDEIFNINLSNFFEAGKFYILENIDKIADEEFLFHLINSVSEANSFLILTAIDLEKFCLKDLKSRLKNIVAIEIKNPSLESMKQLLVQAFACKQIRLENRIVNFIAENIDRNYVAIYDAVKLVEMRNYEFGKAINMAEAKALFVT